MPLIIDANNVLETTGALPPDLAGPDLAELGSLIEHSRYGAEQVYLVCDGPERASGRDLPPRLRPIFAGASRPPKSADAVIAAIVRKSSYPKRLLVVSSDRAVQVDARRRRCKVLESAAFLRQLALDDEGHRAGRHPRRPTRIQDDEALRAWVDVFDPDGRLLDAVAEDIARADAEAETAKQARLEAEAAEAHAAGGSESGETTPPLPPAIDPRDEFPADILRDAEDLTGEGPSG